MDDDDVHYSNLAWPGFGKPRRHANSKKSRPVRSKYDSAPGLYDSPPVPYDSPPGPYDSPESDGEKENDTSEKICTRSVCWFFWQMVLVGLRTAICTLF